MATNQMQFGLLLESPGISYNSWLHPTTLADASVNFSAAKTLIQMAEAAHFTFAFVGDNVSIDAKAKPHYLNRLEPITLLSGLAALTSKIGLVSTISTTYSQPFTVARQIGSLDVLSGGRAGWNAVTSAHEAAAANFGGSQLPEHTDRYAVADEYIEVMRGLWDTWEDDAFMRDKASRKFVDLNKMHVLNHRGRSFQVKGPLNLQRSPQGHPVTFQAGSSESGRSFAARQADAIFAREYDMDSAQRFYADLKSRAVNAGRNPDHLKIFMGAQVIVAPTMAEAEEKYERILSYVSDEDALQNLAYFYNHMDFSKYDLDAPFPDVASEGAKFFRGFTATFANDAKRLNLTLRQVARRVATLKEDFFGTPSQVADAMEAWLTGGAMDGFMIGNWVQPDGLQDFILLVVPELKRRGIYADEYRGNTLRENLGVPIPANRYAEGRRSSPAA